MPPLPTPTVALALDRRLVGRRPPRGPPRPPPCPPAATAARTATLLGDQVLGDLRLVEVLVIGERREARRPAGPASRAANPRPTRTASTAAAAERSTGSSSSSLDVGVEPARQPAAARGAAGVAAPASSRPRPRPRPRPPRRRRRRPPSSPSRRRPRRRLDAFGACRRIEVVEREHLGRREVGLGQAAGLATGARRAVRSRPSPPAEPFVDAAAAGAGRDHARRDAADGRLGLAGPTATAAARRRGHRGRRPCPRSACRGPRSSTGRRRRRRRAGPSASPSRRARAG